VLVPVYAVSTNHLVRTTILDGAVATDNLVVATAVLETTLAMPTVNFAEAALLSGANRGTVNDDQGDNSHGDLLSLHDVIHT
jgi:hypothetical protein